MCSCSKNDTLLVKAGPADIARSEKHESLLFGGTPMTLAPLEKVEPQKGTRKNGRPMAWHTLTKENVLLKLQSRLNGLSDDQVDQRQQEFGPNILPGPQPPTLTVVFLHQFLDPVIDILLAAGGVSLLLGEIKEALFIFGAVVLNAGIGTYQKWQEVSSAAVLQNLLNVYARVKRGGVEGWISADELVPGDIVQLEPGDRVPADLRLIGTNNLAIDESFLTGESLAAAKNTAPLTRDSSTGDRSNMAFAGSTVISGLGVGVVVATGLRTKVSRIVEKVVSVEMATSPVVLREKFARRAGLIVLAAGILFAVIALAQGISYAEVFFLGVVLAVAAIPEGIPLATTVALWVATVRMAKRGVHVRRLAAVESLGSCTCIASDKTGTLTTNQQTVKLIYLPVAGHFIIPDEGDAGNGKGVSNTEKLRASKAWPRLKHLVRAGILGNDAQLVYREGVLTDQGDVVDVAFLALGRRLGLHPHLIRGNVKPMAVIPFQSERGYTAHLYQDKSRVRVVVKGAVERVLPSCQRMQTGLGLSALDRAVIEQETLTMAENGYRVLAVAEAEITAPVDLIPLTEENIPPLTLLGLVGLSDPVRPEAKSAVKKCREAGIEVVMVTGDHPATALAVAREVGIATSEQEVMTGCQLAEIGSTETLQFLERVKAACVFARITPVQKLHIVEAMIKLGHVVMVTGAGVNDAPPLRRAHIGAALGSGSEAAKTSASLIVADNSFASLAAGIEEGRFAHNNVRKITYLLISTSAAEVILFTLAFLTDLPLPLFARQLLWLNLVINGIQGMTLAFEAGESGVMTRQSIGGIFDRRMVQQTVTAGATMGLISYVTWYGLHHAGWDEAAARNLLLLLMVLFQNFHVVNCRSEHESAFKAPLRCNVLLVGGVVISLGLHLLAMQTPFMQALLNIAPVSLLEFIYLLLLASPILFVMELFKRIVSFSRPKMPGSGT